MIAQKNTQTVIYLTLTEEEARWLMGVVQNPLGGLSPDQELPIESQHRKDLFMALQEVLYR